MPALFFFPRSAKNTVATKSVSIIILPEPVNPAYGKTKECCHKWGLYYTKVQRAKVMGSPSNPYHVQILLQLGAAPLTKAFNTPTNIQYYNYVQVHQCMHKLRS